MLIFDIGANIGNWSLANIGNDNQIVAVEASPKNFKELEQNCILKNIIPLKYAVVKISL